MKKKFFIIFIKSENLKLIIKYIYILLNNNNIYVKVLIRKFHLLT